MYYIAKTKEAEGFTPNDLYRLFYELNNKEEGIL